MGSVLKFCMKLMIAVSSGLLKGPIMEVLFHMTVVLHAFIRSHFRTLKTGNNTLLVRMRIHFPKMLKVEL